jgi:hypothetical protein
MNGPASELTQREQPLHMRLILTCFCLHLHPTG